MHFLQRENKFSLVLNYLYTSRNGIARANLTPSQLSGAGEGFAY